MIVRIDIDGSDATGYDYRVVDQAEDLYADSGLESVAETIVAAVEGLPPRVLAVEIAFRGIVSGTYPLETVAANHEPIAAHAINTTLAIEEALG